LGHPTKSVFSRSPQTNFREPTKNGPGKKRAGPHVDDPRRVPALYEEDKWGPVTKIPAAKIYFRQKPSRSKGDAGPRPAQAQINPTPHGARPTTNPKKQATPPIALSHTHRRDQSDLSKGRRLHILAQLRTIIRRPFGIAGRDPLVAARGAHVIAWSGHVAGGGREIRRKESVKAWLNQRRSNSRMWVLRASGGLVKTYW